MPHTTLNRLYLLAVAFIFCFALVLRVTLSEPRAMHADKDEAQYMRLGAAISDDFKMYDT